MHRDQLSPRLILASVLAVLLAATLPAAAAEAKQGDKDKAGGDGDRKQKQDAPKAEDQPADESEPPMILTREQVDGRIKGFIGAIWALQNEQGHWDTMKAPNPPNPGRPFDIQLGGTTALALLALRSAGEDEQDPRFQKAMAWLNEQQWTGTYYRGLRATLYGQMKDPKYKKLLFEDGQFLLSSFIPGVGMYTYFPPQGSGGDYSNTQYGILGVWSAADRGMEVDLKYWKAVEQGYLASICGDGGFGYAHGGKGAGYGSMTVAALASLFVVWEKLYIAHDKNCSGDVNRELLKAIDGGLKWMGKNYSSRGNPDGKGGLMGYYFYYLYGTERVGVASGLKYFGEHDWYKEAAYNIVCGKGNPAGVLDTSWALLFLCYGRAPVAFNKLDYGKGWNEHPREYAMLCRQLSRKYEKHHNWQIMPITARPDEFHDAPILAMSGKNAFALKPDEVAKLKAFIQQGGLLFAEAIGDSAAFTNSMKALCLQMFPGLELSRLGGSHPVYSAHHKLGGPPPELLGLSDGVRTLVLVAPREFSCDWQRMEIVKGRRSFEFGANLLQYATDRGQLWSKEQSYWPIDRGNKPSATITVARLIHTDAAAEHVWNPTGGTGWQRMDILSRNADGPAIATITTDLSKPLDPKAVPVLHATGIGAMMLSDGARKNLAAYAKAGGLVLVDAAGGNQGFIDNFVKIAPAIFGAKLVPVPPLDFLAQACCEKDGKVWYRHRDGLPRSLRPLEMLGVNNRRDEADNWNVLFLPYDLTYAMVGNPCTEPVGMDPASAEKVVLSLLTSTPAGRAAAPPPAVEGGSGEEEDIPPPSNLPKGKDKLRSIENLEDK